MIHTYGVKYIWIQIYSEIYMTKVHSYLKTFNHGMLNAVYIYDVNYIWIQSCEKSIYITKYMKKVFHT